MIVDDYIARFLATSEPLMIHAAATGKERRFYSVRGFGLNADAASGLARIYILRTQVSRLLACLSEGSGMMTVLATNGRNNESYQLKGPVVEHRPCVASEDDEALTRYRESSLRAFPKLYEQFPLTSAVCHSLVFRVTDIYVQTPAPGAGKRYESGADA